MPATSDSQNSGSCASTLWQPLRVASKFLPQLLTLSPSLWWTSYLAAASYQVLEQLPVKQFFVASPWQLCCSVPVVPLASTAGDHCYPPSLAPNHFCIQPGLDVPGPCLHRIELVQGCGRRRNTAGGSLPASRASAAECLRVCAGPQQKNWQQEMKSTETKRWASQNLKRASSGSTCALKGARVGRLKISDSSVS